MSNLPLQLGDVELAWRLAMVLALGFFLGLAFEDVFSQGPERRPGGVRTFPILGLIAATLYLLDPVHLIGFSVGLLVLGSWLFLYYGEHLHMRDEQGKQNVGVVVVALNVYAYVLGAMAVALPHWATIGMTVVVVLLFTARERLHAFARRIEIQELITAAEFLIIVGLVLPLLPAEPVTTLTTITPRGAWLALVVVCGLSYASYLVQRYLAPGAGSLWTAALGGLYSSTATTVVLARQCSREPATVRQAQAGIILATSVMYVRILAIVAIFNFPLALIVGPWLLGLCVVGLALAGLHYRFAPHTPHEGERKALQRNPLELGAAVTFSLAFVAISLLTAWFKTQFGVAGIYWLAAIVGVTDVDPFVLNLAQGGTAGLPLAAIAAAILIAASSNNVLKAVYAALFAGWRVSLPSVLALLGLAVVGLVLGLTIVV